MSKTFITSFLLLVCSTATWGQQELGLHFLRNTWQASKTNPAIMTDQRWHIGLPNLYFNLSHTGPAYNEVVIQNDAGNNALDIGAVLEQLEDDNQLYSNVELETFSLAFGYKNLQLSASHAVKFNAFMDYPKSLVELAWNGNAQFIDQTVDIGPDFQTFAYNEYAIGAAMRLSKLTGGIRLKLLTGIGDASTTENELSLYTDPDIYQLTVNANYQINTSSFFAYDENGNFELDFGKLTIDRLLTSNFGVAVDLGATIELGKLNLAASITDLGAINWNSNLNNYTSEGTFTYDGIDVSEIIKDNNISFESTLDTLSEVFGFSETNEEYSTTLPTKLYVSANYEISDGFTIGGLFYSEYFRDRLFPAVALSARKSFGEKLTVGANYSIRNQDYLNVGLNATFRLGPLQLFAVTDNVIAAFQPYDSRNVNARVGVNLLFDK